MSDKKTPERMLLLREYLNRVFVEKRDTGGSTLGVYRRLEDVEFWLNSRGIVW